MLYRQSKLDGLYRKAGCQRPRQSQGGMDTLILGAGKPHGSDQLFLKAGNILHVSLTAKDLVRSYRVPGQNLDKIFSCYYCHPRYPHNGTNSSVVFGKCYLLGQFQVISASRDNCLQELQTAFSMQCSFNHRVQPIKITSNGSIDWSCVHKCFSLGQF